MTEQKLVVRKENLPARCEICHQADRFDRQSGICTRCQTVAVELPQEALEKPVWVPLQPHPGVRRAFIWLFVSSLICVAGCTIGEFLMVSPIWKDMGVLLYLAGGLAGVFSLACALGLGLYWLLQGLKLVWRELIDTL